MHNEIKTILTFDKFLYDKNNKVNNALLAEVTPQYLQQVNNRCCISAVKVTGN
jgi:hypothetical protein